MHQSMKSRRKFLRLKAKKQLEVFDLDRTLVSRNCSFDFCRYLVSKKVLPKLSLFSSLVYYFRHQCLGMDLVQLHHNVFNQMLKGRFFPQIEDRVEPFLSDYLTSKMYPPAIARLRLAQHLGNYTLILSNSPSFLVRKIAAFLGVDEWRATEYSVDKEMRLCEIASIMQGEDKASSALEIAAKLSIPKEEIIAYSDSILDLPLLLTAGKAVAVNPDRKLRQLSITNRWTIL